MFRAQNRKKTIPFIVAVCVVLIAGGCYENFGPAKKIVSMVGGTWKGAGIVADEDRLLHVVARNNTYVKHYWSDDYGDSWHWGDVIDQTDCAYFSTSPEVELHADTYGLYVVYSAYEGAESGKLCFSRSTDNGTTWSTPTRLRYGSNIKDQFRIESAGIVTNGTLVVAWREFTGETYEIRTKRSTDRGSTWESSLTAVEGHEIALLGLRYTGTYSRLCLLYGSHPGSDRYKAEIASKYSSDDGAAWGNRNQVNNTDYGKSYDILGGDLEKDPDGNLIAVWSTSTDLRAALSADGYNWTDHETIRSSDGQRTDVNLVYVEGFPPVISYRLDRDIYYTEHDGDAWLDSRRLNNYVDSVINFGGLAANSGDLDAVWFDTRWNGNDLAQMATAHSDPSPAAENWGIDIIQSTTFPVAYRGEEVTYNVRIGNWTSERETGYVWVEAEGENGVSVVLRQGVITLDSQYERTVHFSKTIPGSAPLQTYEVTAYVSTAGYFTDPLDQDTFEVLIEP